MQAIDVGTEDGFTLRAHLWRSAGASATVLLPPAMGVKQDYYFAFAQWLHAQGYTVATFDYRGMGASRPAGSLAQLKADLFDWTRDYEAMIDLLAAEAPEQPLYVVGHSLGAQLPGMLRNKGRIAGLLCVAAGSGYWRDNAPPTRRMVLYFWYVAVPLFTRLFGYFPGKRLKKVGDVPAGVMLQWRKWCLNPRYNVGAEPGLQARYDAARFPVVALSITDDEMMTLRGTQTLVDFYANAERRIERIAPQDVGARRIGHFGFFREQFAATLWPKIPQLLAAF
ncbi:alpha/beta hydrolase [beta proteobacterium AAP99]|nr:alpha/beta hydrolase [beta proteobacterium AAP99]